MIERLKVEAYRTMRTGSLVSISGSQLDWERASECHRELDKLIWVVLVRQASIWQVEHLEVCATEQPGCELGRVRRRCSQGSPC